MNNFSIRLRILIILLPAMALVMVGNFWFSRDDAMIAGNAAYDRSLLGAIKSLDLNTNSDSGALSVELPYRLFEFFQLTASGKVYFRVATTDRLVEIGNPDLPIPPTALKSGEAVFYDATYFGESVRIGALMRPLNAGDLDGEQLMIQVAENTEPRQKFTDALLNRAAWRDLWLWSITGILVIAGMNLALKPLTRLASQTKQRKADDLRSLPVLGLSDDLKPLVEAVNQQLQNTKKLMDERRAFIDDASHQLRTPLTILKTQLDFAMREVDADRQKECMFALSDELNAAIRATNQLLALGQSDASSADHVYFDINELVRAVAMSVLPLARNSCIDLGIDLIEEPILAKGDKHLLHHALLNMAHNALVHGKPKGTVTLKAEFTNQTHILTVIDNGTGLPSEVFKRLGERFIKGKNSRGSGLGLAIASSVMTKHHGSVKSKFDKTLGLHIISLEWQLT
jgi:two-component system sensor histidine kinase TctE